MLQGSEVETFHRLYYESSVWTDTSWLGVPVQKCPLGLWIYQEILVDLRPDVIVETGSAAGGSALFLASICDLIGRGRVVTIDTVAVDRPAHPRIDYVHGSSTDPTVIARIGRYVEHASRVLVVLDSDHAAEHVLAELDAYALFVTPGSYLIVEDTNVNGDPHGPGPREAVNEFLAGGNSFTVDQRPEKSGMTFNPGGYLRRR